MLQPRDRFVSAMVRSTGAAIKLAFEGVGLKKEKKKENKEIEISCLVFDLVKENSFKAVICQS